MAVGFFSLLFALSWGDVSLVAPAAASLTFIGNAFAAKIFLHEKVDRGAGWLLSWWRQVWRCWPGSGCIAQT